MKKLVRNFCQWPEVSQRLLVVEERGAHFLVAVPEEEAAHPIGEGVVDQGALGEPKDRPGLSGWCWKSFSSLPIFRWSRSAALSWRATSFFSSSEVGQATP